MESSQPDEVSYNFLLRNLNKTMLWLFNFKVKTRTRGGKKVVELPKT